MAAMPSPSLGYGHPGWTAALGDQAAQLNFQSNAVPMDVRARAAQQLVAFSAGLARACSSSTAAPRPTRTR